MTIRRQYQLPNCSLILDGLSIDSTPGDEEVMSLLVNAECRISGLERSLNGNYSFFSALVRAVSQYSQELLSGFAHPQVIEDETLLVHINPGDGPYHHLVVQPEIADLGESGDGRAIDIKLSSVQLFDLSEAVDQFFDDTQTLPELEPLLSPLPRRFVRTEEPLSDRALPAVLGIGGLVAATVAIGLLPVPKAPNPAKADRPDQPAQISDATSTNSANDKSSNRPPTGDGTEPAVDGLAAANLSSPLWDKAPRITDETKLAALQQTLESKITGSLAPNANFTEVLDYQVAVNEAGELVGYRFGNDAALRDVDNTPLPKLARANANAQGLEKAAIAQYQVAFNADGIAVSPWQDGTAVAAAPAVDSSPTADPAKTTQPAPANSPANSTVAFDDAPPTTPPDLLEVEALNNQLKQTIVENRNQPRVGSATTYRVRFNQAGEVVAYSPVDSDASTAVNETPLPKLLTAAPKNEPAVDYRVVFTERGVVEVSPWWGWSRYE
ncbi:MAG: hypothetical protein DCF15_02715 [Phormidesmis priestleyi]|uniref:DUF4335 domain-containing protein n=1 Tax=Phormidesmis priestleyi TaxID=268141 RepID=A0A2W4ZYL0_9CYAN|nr:MAG: hypothetical protein DCF15_02715 [Phormidesmis priestleyi]